MLVAYYSKPSHSKIFSYESCTELIRQDCSPNFVATFLVNTFEQTQEHVLKFILFEVHPLAGVETRAFRSVYTHLFLRVFSVVCIQTINGKPIYICQLGSY